jgi:hypothetical protein
MALNTSLNYQSPSQKAYGNSIYDRINISTDNPNLSKDPVLNSILKRNPVSIDTAKEIPTETETDKEVSHIGKAIAIGQLGGVAGIVYAFSKKTGFWKGVGFYLIGSFTGGLLAKAYLGATIK